MSHAMNVLVFAPHNDDEVLGLGGTIHQLSAAGHRVTVCEVTSGIHAASLQTEAKAAHAVLGVKESIFLEFPVVRLKTLNPADLNRAIGQVVKKTSPRVVFIPFVGDMHSDHREVTESVLVAVRPLADCPVDEVFMYETLSETGWNLPNAERSFIPDTWVDISESLDAKLAAMRCYASQIKPYPNPRSEDGIRALAMFRGSTVGVPCAESFMTVRRIVRRAWA
jgi:LmbE family N-acetylglucosaminyl deacetylase